MIDRRGLLENEQELKFSGEQGFFDKSRLIHFFILLFFGLSLFAFLHFREIRVDSIELNTLAPRYVISQIDFSFPDEEATFIERQKAVQDIGKIYYFSKKEIRRQRIELDNFLQNSLESDKTGSISSVSDITKIGETIEKILFNVRMTDGVTLEKIEKSRILVPNYLIFVPKSPDVASKLPPVIWDSIFLGKMNLQSFPGAAILSFFKPTEWHFEEDTASERQIRKEIQSQIPEKLGDIEAGSRIIDQGDKITTRQLAMIQAMKTALGEKRNLSHPLTLIGTAALTLLFIAIFLSYFKRSQPQILASNRKLALLVTVFVLTLGFGKLFELLLLNSHLTLIEIFRYPILVPFAAILICSLLNASTATFSAVFLAILFAIALAFDWEGILILNITASVIAILNTHTLRRRKEIFLVCLKSALAATIAILALHLYQSELSTCSIAGDIASTFFFMLLTAILIVGFLPLLEACFGVMTDVTLMEYLDPDNTLLRRLTLEAGGTYQHSVIVGNLAETAAVAIGANGLFCRVATLYHDIGKITTPQYFIENQAGGMNLHKLLTPKESAEVILAHVPEGVALAREAGLPEALIDVIKEHHGTTLVYYFYRKELERFGGDKSVVDQKEFRYAGPTPRSKESGIIMITDSFEAASRSLDVINEETLTELLNKIILDKFVDGQFDNSLLTFRDLAIIKKSLVKNLLAAGHSRVKYPSEETQEKSKALTNQQQNP